MTVGFLVVDYIEAVSFPSDHVADFKVEPLMMVIGVNVRTQDQVILSFSNLLISDTVKSCTKIYEIIPL